jgi:hypothetical protein
MNMFPLKVIRPGLLEIVGHAPGSSTYYVPIRSIRSFAVHENPVCIELHLGTVPSSGSIHTKVLFCTKEQLLDVVEFLTTCISSVGVLGTYASLENMKGRIILESLNTVILESLNTVILESLNTVILGCLTGVILRKSPPI